MGNILLNRIHRNPIVNNQKTIQQKNGTKCKNVFGEILNKKINNEKLSFSAHASKRLEQRGINLTSNDIQNLNDAVRRVSEKGAKESLIMMNNVSYIVNVKNKTVITAVDDNSAKNNVFTNIDSAIQI